MPQAEEPQHIGETPEPPVPAESPAGRGRSWWWVLPALLVAWLAYSAVARRPHETANSTTDTLLNQSLAAANSGRYAECIATARKALELNASLPEAFNNIGWCSAKLGDWDAAVRNLQQALTLKPDMELARRNLIWALSQKSAPPPHQPVASKPADAAVLRSLQHAQAHQYRECIDAARDALRLDPASAEAYNNLGYCYGGLGQWDEGIRNLHEALRIRPDFALAKGNLSWLTTEKAKSGVRTER